MAQFLVHNRHAPEECQALFEEYDAVGGMPDGFRGHEYFCTCPTGDHGGFGIVDGESADAVLSSLPPKYRAGARVLPGEILDLKIAQV